MSISLSKMAGGLALCAGIAVASHDASAPSQGVAPAHGTGACVTTVSPDEALKRLVDGNQRYLAARSDRARADQARRCDTFANGQHPFAVVLSCADSRAPVELLFDQGIGDLFVVRVAGNVADVDEIGTIEYGAGHLNSPLVVVLGHTKCGAVTAVVNHAKVSPNIAQLVDNIVPAVQAVKHDHPELTGEALVGSAIEANVMQSIRDLLTNSEEMRHLVSGGKVKVVGAVYDLHNGTIEWLGEHPKQAEFLEATGGSSHPENKNVPEKAPSHSHHNGSPGDDTQAAHDASHDSHKTVTSHDEPVSSTSQPSMPHQSGTFAGMLIPAGFLGGAGLVSASIFFRMKGSGNTQPAEPAQNPGAH